MSKQTYLLRNAQIRDNAIYGGGKKLPGLVTRREKEKALCLES